MIPWKSFKHLFTTANTWHLFNNSENPFKKFKDSRIPQRPLKLPQQYLESLKGQLGTFKYPGSPSRLLKPLQGPWKAKTAYKDHWNSLDNVWNPFKHYQTLSKTPHFPQITHETSSSISKSRQKPWYLFNNGNHLRIHWSPRGLFKEFQTFEGPWNSWIPSKQTKVFWRTSGTTLNNHKSHESLLDSPRPSEIPLEHPWKPVQGPLEAPPQWTQTTHFTWRVQHCADPPVPPCSLLCTSKHSWRGNGSPGWPVVTPAIN